MQHRHLFENLFSEYIPESQHLRASPPPHVVGQARFFSIRPRCNFKVGHSLAGWIANNSLGAFVSAGGQNKSNRPRRFPRQGSLGNRWVAHGSGGFNFIISDVSVCNARQDGVATNYQQRIPFSPLCEEHRTGISGFIHYYYFVYYLLYIIYSVYIYYYLFELKSQKRAHPIFPIRSGLKNFDGFHLTFSLGIFLISVSQYYFTHTIKRDLTCLRGVYNSTTKQKCESCVFNFLFTAA